MKKLILSLAVVGLFVIGSSMAFAGGACGTAKESAPACASTETSACDADKKRDCGDKDKKACCEKKSDCDSKKSCS